MRTILGTAVILAATAGQAIAADPACRSARGMLYDVRDMLFVIEMFYGGFDRADNVAMEAENLSDRGEGTIEKTMDEGWPADYRETLGKLVALGTDLAARGGELAEGEAATIRSYAVALKTVTAERCVGDDIAVFIEPGGLACEWVVKYLNELAEHQSSLRGDGDPAFLYPIAEGALRSAGSARNTNWSEETITAMDRVRIITGDIARGVADPSADAAAEVVALSTILAAEAQAICPTDTIPNLSAGT